MAKTENYEDLNYYVYRKIKELIRDKFLLPGTKIIQEQLANELGVSRTPLIKALERLTSERMVEHIPRRGYYVKNLSKEEMLEIFAIRQVIEGVVAKTVAVSASEEEIKKLKDYFNKFDDNWDHTQQEVYRQNDQKFHQEMVQLAGNSLLIDIDKMFNIYSFSYQKGLMRPPEETLSEHQDIIRAIEKRDARGAQLKAMEHIEKSYNRISRIFSDDDTNHVFNLG